jgi:hypothetical protein
MIRFHDVGRREAKVTVGLGHRTLNRSSVAIGV